MHSKAQVVTQIQRLHREDRPLNITAVKRRWPKLIDSVYARKKYWGWKQALEDAGISYEKIKVELMDYVPCGICGEHFSNLGSHIWIMHECSTEEYLSDYPGSDIACEMLRTHHNVCRRSEQFFLPHWEPIWTPEYALDRMYAYHQMGAPLNLASCKRYDSPLTRQAVKHLGSWDQALEKIGVDPLESRLRRDRSAYHRPEGVLAEIRRRYRAGLPLNTFALVTAKDASLRDQRLSKWGQKHFGSWPAAVKAAGIEPKAVTHRKKAAVYRSKAAVKREIKRRRRDGLPLNHHAVAKGKSSERDVSLVKAALRLYGNWDNALGGLACRVKRWRLRASPSSPSIRRFIGKSKK